eukprot:scaffold1940_cov78-Phaeocystis_antarctica.AAC.7
MVVVMVAAVREAVKAAAARVEVKVAVGTVAATHGGATGQGRVGLICSKLAAPTPEAVPGRGIHLTRSFVDACAFSAVLPPLRRGPCCWASRRRNKNSRTNKAVSEISVVHVVCVSGAEGLEVKSTPKRRQICATGYLVRESPRGAALSALSSRIAYAYLTDLSDVWASCFDN